MCGISGFVDFAKKSSVEHLKIMNDTLVHRGPDGSGYEFFENETAQTALGHRRLSIIDLSEAGHQPMYYKHFCISFNGEIYNYAEIKKTLETSGHVFKSHSDTEVVLHAFEEWGVKMLDQFIGMFSFVIYDQLNLELICFRDRAGAKPFYYYFHNDLFLFASELKAFHQHPRFKKIISKQGLSQYFRKGYISAPITIFEHCHKLLPAHYLKISLHSKKVETIRYWNVLDAYRKPTLQLSEEEAKANLLSILKSAFQYRMVADVPVGIFLSGGYDSSLVTAILQHESTQPIHTFTIGFQEDHFNESSQAKKVADFLGTKHSSHICSKQEALDIIPELPWVFDEPLMDNSIIPTILVSRLAKKEVTVALSSDAGDEIFAGYTTYDHLLKFEGYRKLWPQPILNAGASLLNALPLSSLPGISESILNKQFKLGGLLNADNILEANEKINAVMSERTLSHLLHEVSLADLILPDFKLSSLNTLLANDYLHYMCDDVLMKVDRACMSASLEGREPFLDHRIVEFAAQLPESMKYRNGIKKYLLKEITHDYLPKSMMDRPKKGFSIPINQWLRNELRELVNEQINYTSIQQYGILNTKKVMELKRDWEQGKLYNPEIIWQLLVFQLWLQKWM